MLNPPGLSGEPLKRMFMDAYAVGFLYMFRHGWSVPMLHTMATILVPITAIRPVAPYHLVYCLMRDKPPALILSSLLKIYIASYRGYDIEPKRYVADRGDCENSSGFEPCGQELHLCQAS